MMHVKNGSLHISIILFIIIILASVTAVFFTTPLNDNERGYEGFEADGLVYGAMAGARYPDIQIPEGAPWRYRVLTPFLVSLLPWSVLQNFLVLAFVSNVLSLFVLLLILKRYVFSDELCLIGLLLYGGVFWALKFSFYSPAYIDFQTQLFLLVIIYLTITKRYILLVPALILSVLQKESLAIYSLFSVIHLLRNHYHRINTRTVLIAVSIVVPPVFTLFLVRFVIHVEGGYGPTVFLYWMSKMIEYRFWPKFSQAVFSGLGFIPALLVVRYGPWAKFLRKNFEWIIYFLISIFFLFGGIDKARLFLYMVPLAVILSLQVIQEYKSMVSNARFYVWVSLTLLFHCFIGGYLSPMGSFSNYLAKLVPMHSGWSFLPFLYRNLAAALIFITFTIWFIIGELHFHLKEGFIRRDPSLGKNHD